MQKHIVSFSGGKDSTAMLLMMIEKGIRIDEIICIDTTKEFPQMYEHIEKVENFIRIEITKVKIDFDYWFGEHVKTKGKNIGEVGYGWPDFGNRWCTALKREAGKKFIKTSDFEYQGIAYDELKRLENNKNRNIWYPLVAWEMTESDCLQYCYDKGFDWGGLYEKMKRVSCWCCPLSRIGELRTLYNEFPELWTRLQEMDKLSYRKFRNDYSIDELTKGFLKGN